MSDAVLGSLLGTVGGTLGAYLVWMGTRQKVKSDQTVSLAQIAEQRRQAEAKADEERRQSDINLIIDTLKEQLEDVQQTVKEQRDELATLRAENRECLADRDQMRGELRRMTRRIEELEQGGDHSPGR